MSAHPTHVMHEHSIESYRSAIAALSERSTVVRNWVEQHGPATDRQVMAGLGFTDPNKVRPRITELVDAKLLVEIDKRIENNRKVRVVDIPKFEQQRYQESIFHAH